MGLAHHISRPYLTVKLDLVYEILFIQSLQQCLKDPLIFDEVISKYFSVLINHFRVLLGDERTPPK